MHYKQAIRYFFLGFFSVFKFGSPKLAVSKPRDIVTYVFKVEDYINIAYKSLRNNHEGN